MSNADCLDRDEPNTPGCRQAVTPLADHSGKGGRHLRSVVVPGAADPAIPAESCRLPRRFRGDRGASAVEYALLIAGIAAVIIVAVTFVGRSVSSQFSKVGSSISTTN